VTRLLQFFFGSTGLLGGHGASPSEGDESLVSGIPGLRYLVLLVLIGGAISLGFITTNSQSAISDIEASEDLASQASLTDPLITDMVSPQDVSPKYIEKSASLGKGGTLAGLLADQGVKRTTAHMAIKAIREIYDVRRIRRGTSVDIRFEETSDISAPLRLDRIVINAAADRKVIAERSQSGSFTSNDVYAELSASTVRVHDTISDSLYLSARQAGLPDAVIVNAIRIFSYDVDFQREVRNGDQFEFFYERFHDDQGNLIKDGNVIYGSLTLSGKKIDLHRFTPSDTQRTEYFHENGQTARKALMRTPIDGARLTSGYGKRRHPILGYRKMHRGLDFGARRGTPIMAAGDGIIKKLGRNGGYGKYILIRHNSTYSTAYAHMNGYRKGLRRGSRVEQGDIIGYVGSTGRSTGPHLHYEVLKNGRQTNPLRVKMPTGRKLKGGMLAEFEAAAFQTRSLLAEAPHQAQVARAD
jgi:murein DD-endopeptidase MepM/ murein hydrolase activator NlpD